MWDRRVGELVIAQTDGSAWWDLAHDLLDDPLQANPHDDRQGNKGVWHFLDMANSNRARKATGDPGLAAWQKAVSQGKREQVEQAAQQFQKTFTKADASSPFWI